MKRPLGLAAVGVFLALACGRSTSELGGGGTPDGGDGGRDGGGGTPADSGDGDGGTCGSVVLQGTRAPGTVLVAFDQSLSMNQKFGDAGPKYKVASEALLAAITPLAGELNLGAVFFPTQAADAGTNSCPPVDPISVAPPQISVADGGAFINAWNAHFQPPWKLLLGTPLGDALNQIDSATAVESSGKTAVVVLTDGQPNCGEQLAQILVPVQDMFSRGVKTFVIGLPGATGATVLRAVADAGGTGDYYLPSDAAQLETQLAQIASGVVDPCTILLNPPPADPNQVHLVVTLSSSGMVVQIAQSAPGGGWAVVDGGTEAVLYGQTCQDAESGAFSKLEFDYGCVMVPFQ